MRFHAGALETSVHLDELSDTEAIFIVRVLIIIHQGHGQRPAIVIIMVVVPKRTIHDPRSIVNDVRRRFAVHGHNGADQFAFGNGSCFVGKTVVVGPYQTVKSSQEDQLLMDLGNGQGQKTPKVGRESYQEGIQGSEILEVVIVVVVAGCL